MGAKQFRTYFFGTEDINGLSFEAALQNIMDVETEKRVTTMGVRLLSLSEHTIGNKRYIYGDIERMYMDNLPNKTSVSEEPDELELNDDEGLGYNTAFVYYPAKKVLAMQSNPTGVGYSRFRDYMNEMLHTNSCANGFCINPIIVDDENARRILQGEVNPSFKRITFTIDNPDRFTSLMEEEQGSIIKDFVKNASDTAAVKMAVTLSAGRETERFLDQAKIKKMIQKLITFGNEDRVKKLEVRASLEGGENTDLNFLPNKMQYVGSIEVDRNQPAIEDRMRAIMVAVHRFSDFIESRIL